MMDKRKIDVGCEAGSFYSDLVPWTPAKNCYPTWDDVMRFYISRTQSKVPQGDAVRELSTFVYDIWDRGDGCPKTAVNIQKQFISKVLPVYVKYRKGEGRAGKSHKKELPVVVAEPTRKSRRIQSPPPSATEHQVECVPDVDLSRPTEKPTPPQNVESEAAAATRVRTRRSDTGTNKGKSDWLEDQGNQSFDVFF